MLVDNGLSIFTKRKDSSFFEDILLRRFSNASTFILPHFTIPEFHWKMYKGKFEVTCDFIENRVIMSKKTVPLLSRLGSEIYVKIF